MLEKSHLRMVLLPSTISSLAQTASVQLSAARLAFIQQNGHPSKVAFTQTLPQKKLSS
jgi:hypothetical protein